MPDVRVERILELGAEGDPHVFNMAHMGLDRKSTRLNSSHANISYAVFCLKKKKAANHRRQAQLSDAAAPALAEEQPAQIETANAHAVDTPRTRMSFPSCKQTITTQTKDTD